MIFIDTLSLNNLYLKTSNSSNLELFEIELYQTAMLCKLLFHLTYFFLHNFLRNIKFFLENIALNIEDFSQTCVTSAGRDNLSRQKSGQGISK